MLEDHYRKLENMYSIAPVNEFYLPTMKVETNKATIEITTSKQHWHAANSTHGSIYFKMLDDAAFFAAQSSVVTVFVLTSQFNVHLLRPIFEEKITSVGRIITQTKNNIIAEAELFNEKGKLLATGRGNFALSRIPLSEDIGYKL